MENSYGRYRHTRGILATAELADAAGLDPSTRVLDLSSDIGGAPL